MLRLLEQITRTRALGQPEITTVEKGEEIIQVATREVVAFFREHKS